MNTLRKKISQSTKINFLKNKICLFKILSAFIIVEQQVFKLTGNIFKNINYCKDPLFIFKTAGDLRLNSFNSTGSVAAVNLKNAAIVIALIEGNYD